MSNPFIFSAFALVSVVVVIHNWVMSARQSRLEKKLDELKASLKDRLSNVQACTSLCTHASPTCKHAHRSARVHIPRARMHVALHVCTAFCQLGHRPARAAFVRQP